MEAQLTLSEADIKALIAEHLRTKGYKLTTDVEFDIKTGTRCMGYGHGEYNETYVNFNGATVKIEVAPVVDKFDPSNL